MKELKITAFLLVGCLSSALARAEVLNVVSLGAKNDGSADVSAIVNANTAKGALLFPAGIYKVAHPLVLKNPIRGEGYARISKVDATRTWLVSDIVCTNGTRGVVEFGGDRPINVENLNIMCASRECGIRIADCRQGTYTFIDKVGIYGVGAWGLYVKGRGSRPIFAGNMTIFGTTKDPTARAVGIRIEGPADCRLTNVEAMGVNIGLELYNGHTYGDNMHLWTGVMGAHEPTWWNDTRGIVLGPTAHFTGSEIYPDTCYYAFDLKGAGSFCEGPHGRFPSRRRSAEPRQARAQRRAHRRGWQRRASRRHGEALHAQRGGARRDTQERLRDQGRERRPPVRRAQPAGLHGALRRQGLVQGGGHLHGGEDGRVRGHAHA